MGRRCFGEGEPLWGGGGTDGGVQEGGVPGRPEPNGAGASQGVPLSSINDRQLPASSEQQVEWRTLFVAYLTSIGKWHVRPVGGGLVRPTSPEMIF